MPPDGAHSNTEKGMSHVTSMLRCWAVQLGAPQPFVGLEFIHSAFLCLVLAPRVINVLRWKPWTPKCISSAMELEHMQCPRQLQSCFKALPCMHVQVAHIA